ncbi:hypothetical protein [Leucobacter muris]|uniref:hypothetical protein n=1 Tax=Leucobacter muris TaxID=1935379 RepID=UPI001E64C51F|nr:hypothetical protein [Leucobacter muris]
MLLANRRLRHVLPIAIAILGIGIGWALSVGLSGYVVYLAISMVTATISLLGLGIVTGSAGIIALCQLTFSAIGAWVVTFLNKNEAPGGFIVWLLAGAVVAAVAGVLLGLPALNWPGLSSDLYTRMELRCQANMTLNFASAHFGCSPKPVPSTSR